MLLYRTPPSQYPTTIRGTTAKDERPRRNRSGKAVSPPPQPFAGPPRSVLVSPVVVRVLLESRKNVFPSPPPSSEVLAIFQFPPCFAKILVLRFTVPPAGPLSACNSAAAGPSVVEKPWKIPETRRRDQPNLLSLSPPSPCTRREIETPWSRVSSANHAYWLYLRAADGWVVDCRRQTDFD